MRYRTHQSTEFLALTDAVASVAIAEGAEVTRLDGSVDILEIGVWRGGWSETLLASVPETRVVGIDPYPNFEEIRSSTTVRLSAYIDEERFALLDSWSMLCSDVCRVSHRLFACIHVDGDHTFASVLQDLEEALRHLSPDGVVVVDDFWNQSFPGVMGATAEHLARGSLAAWLTTDNKLYLCRPESHAGKMELVRTMQQRFGLPIVLTWQAPGSYSQDGAIRGLAVAQLLMTQRLHFRLRRRLGLHRRIILREEAKRWLPPVALDWLRHAKWRREGTGHGD